jgi:NADH:flavin oxidoreductase / NADH oxidase family
VIQAGFDGVEILVNHPYLLVQFLNRTTHRRTDEYGVRIENRARVLFVVEAVLGEVDRSLVGMKISPMHEGDLMAAHGETRLATQLDSVPRSAARRWVIRQASTRFVGFSVSIPVRPRSGRGGPAAVEDAGGLHIGAERSFQGVMRRHLVLLAVFSSTGPTSACLGDNSPRRAWRRRRPVRP